MQINNSKAPSSKINSIRSLRKILSSRLIANHRPLQPLKISQEIWLTSKAPKILHQQLLWWQITKISFMETVAMEQLNQQPSWRPPLAKASSEASRKEITRTPCLPKSKTESWVHQPAIRVQQKGQEQRTRVEPHQSPSISKKWLKQLKSSRRWLISIRLYTASTKQATIRWASRSPILLQLRGVNQQPIKIQPPDNSNNNSRLARVRPLWGIITAKGARSLGQQTRKTYIWWVALAVIIAIRTISTIVISSSRTSTSRYRVGAILPQILAATSSTVEAKSVRPRTSVQPRSLARWSTFRQPNRCTQQSRWIAEIAQKVTIQTTQLLAQTCLQFIALSTSQTRRPLKP